jgi:endonuclease/exonuclease/phosphatase family metal-dependent hydrolase
MKTRQVPTRSSFRLSATTVAAALILAVSGCATASNQSNPRGFRVMSYNIQHGRGLDGVVDLDRIAAVIKEHRADIVALQEVDRGVERTDRRDLPSELAALTGMRAVFYKNHPHQGGEYGNAILTRFPYRDAANTHLPMVGSAEQRGVLELVVTIHGRDLLFMNTHLDHRPDDAERLASITEISRRLEANQQGPGLPVIFAGDFNAVPGSPTHRRMAEWLIDTWLVAGDGPGATIPVRNPQRRIDYIWSSKDSPFKPVRAWVPYTEASDHLPVVVEFDDAGRAN